MKRVFLIAIIISSLFTPKVLAQWQPVGPYGGAIYSISADSSVALAVGGGLFTSKDDGASWYLVKNAPAVGTSPSVYIYDTSIYLTANDGVFLSTDWGATWNHVFNGINYNVTAMAVKDSTIFLGTYPNGIFVSTNNGGNWVAANNGIPDGGINSIAISDTAILAGTDSGLYLSTNNGSNWTNVTNSLPDTIYSITIKGSNIYVLTDSGLFGSYNNGISWNLLSNGLPYQLESWCISDTGIFVATLNGVYLSTDSGSTWTQMNNGLADPTVQSIVASPPYIFAGTSSGIFLSTDNGLSWAPANKGISNFYIPLIANNGQSLYTSVLGFSDTMGLYLSTDNGNTWQSRNNGLPSGIYAIDFADSDIFVGTHDSGAYLSYNNGASWTACNNGLSILYDRYNIYNFYNNGTGIYACTNVGLFVSTNDGSNWTAMDTVGLNLTSDDVINSMVFIDSLIFLSTSNGVDLGDGKVYVSLDNGSTWMALSSLPPSMGYSIINIGTNIFAFGDQGAFLSTNYGQSWTSLNTALTYLNVTSEFTYGPYLFIGTDTTGVVVTANNGASWSSLGTGFPPSYVTSLAITDSVLFAGTWGYSNWKLPITDITGIPEINNFPAAGFKIYPNPARDQFIVNTQVNGQSLLQVFDVTGRLMLTQNIQTNNTTVDASSLASGVYVVSLKSELRVETNKLVISK